jgi:probable F420-dependent oxidoreductase
MRIGLFAPLAGPFATGEYLTTLGRAAEERGFHSLWVAEHVVLFDDYGSQYPYAANGRIPAPPESGMLEPFTALSFLAAVTKTLRLGTGICLLPQRNPVYTAKEAANVDFLSGGRLDLGIGVGWLAEEFRVVNVPFERRGARCRSYVEVMRTLWCDAVSEHKDEFYELPACRMYPKPVQKPHPPLHFGGETDAALRRVADIGQGWYGFNRDPREAREGISRLEGLLAKRGRKRSDVTVSISPYLKPLAEGDIARYRDAGVDQVILLAFAGDRDGLLRTLDLHATRIAEAGR